jgi:hypothetical protein
MTGPEQLNLVKQDLATGDFRRNGINADGDAGFTYTIAAILAAEDATASTDPNPWRHFLNRLKVYTDVIHQRVAAIVNTQVQKWDNGNR